MINKPLLLCIMDGYGLGVHSAGNAVWRAKKPNLDKLFNTYPNTTLSASGESVGLPKGQMGNSEVGHLNIGAGRVVYTGLSMINNAIKQGTFASTQAFSNAIKHIDSSRGALHIVGLVSDGGVHASQDQIESLCIAMDKKTKQDIFIHVITDGRDVSPTSSAKYIERLQKAIKNTKVKIATICGRLYSMDRDSMFDRTSQAYDAMVSGLGNEIKDINEYINAQYEAGHTDEFIKPGFISGVNGKVKDGDSVIFANYRPDRARQLSHMFVGSAAYEYVNPKPLRDLFLVSMMRYEGIDNAHVAFQPTKLENTLGDVLSKENQTQLRISETQKYPHVTFFFSGGEDKELEGQRKILIDSPKVENFGDAPKMATKEIVDALIPELENFDVIILNFPNADMVGHSGRVEAATEAVETVDWGVGKLYEKIEELGGTMIITADHGNADIMVEKNGEPNTKHTTNPVPFLVTSKGIKLSSGALCDIAPTMLDLLGIKKPQEMTGKSLVD